MRACLAGCFVRTRALFPVDAGGTALRIESKVMYNSGEVRAEIPEAICVRFPAEGCDLS
jgi:hypothetical protein